VQRLVRFWLPQGASRCCSRWGLLCSSQVVKPTLSQMFLGHEKRMLPRRLQWHQELLLLLLTAQQTLDGADAYSREVCRQLLLRCKKDCAGILQHGTYHMRAFLIELMETKGRFVAWAGTVAIEVYYFVHTWRLGRRLIKVEGEEPYWEKREARAGGHGPLSRGSSASVFPAHYSSEAVRLARPIRGDSMARPIKHDGADIQSIGARAKASALERYESWRETPEDQKGEMESDQGLTMEDGVPEDPTEGVRLFSEQLRSFGPESSPTEWAYLNYQLAAMFAKRGQWQDLGSIDQSVFHLKNCSQVPELNNRAYLCGTYH
jgi:hypothetical protein